MGFAALFSVGLHVALIGLLVLWVRRPASVALEPPDTPATVQLVMSPPGGETPPVAPPRPVTPPAPEPAALAKAAPETPPAPPVAAETAQSASPPQPEAPAVPDPAQPPAAEPAARPAAPATAEVAPSPPPATAPSGQSKLSFDFADVESDTNALVTGDLVVPASPDVKFHNRKPSYPYEAAYRGEHGAVVLMIHVAPDGLVDGVDIMQSSGFAALDRAARDAVITWHFLPSVKDGQPVPDDVPVRFVFALN
jgi:protein TonB